MDNGFREKACLYSVISGERCGLRIIGVIGTGYIHDSLGILAEKPFENVARGLAGHGCGDAREPARGEQTQING
jgi:hypothetical protein